MLFWEILTKTLKKLIRQLTKKLQTLKQEEDDDDDDDENSKDENDDEKSSSSKPKYKAPVINDPENVVIRFNGNTQKIELYNQVSQKTIESIKANDFVSMINKLDNNSGILVNKKI